MTYVGKIVIIPRAGSDPLHHYLCACFLAESANYRDEGVVLLLLKLEFSLDWINYK